MTTYYVDYVNGADANNGLGPDASDSTNKPWKTIGKLLGASGMASGDTAYLSPAGPFREVVTVAMTSAVAETKVLGDPMNLQGFKTGAGVSVAPGMVQWTAYTTNDKTAPSGSAVLSLSSRDYLTFENIWLIGGTGSCVAATAVSTNCKFTTCAFTSTTGNALNIVGTFGTALNWTVDRCLFMQTGNQGQIYFDLPSGSGADYDCAFTVKNSWFCGHGGTHAIRVSGSGASANYGGGVVVRNCSIIGGVGLTTENLRLSTSIPCLIYNCLIVNPTSVVALVANTLGQITENYNLIYSGTARTNVNAGAQSISDRSYAPLFHFGQERTFGMRDRPFAQPTAASPLLGFGNDGSQTAYDVDNNPRPAGGASASAGVGARERGNSWAKETSTVRTGANALSITGPGYQDFQLAVDNQPTTVSVYMRYDSTYAGTKPQVQVLNGEECGVTAATSSAVTTVNTWEQLSLSFTPTSQGIVTIRLLSSDTNGGGKAFADDFAVT